MFLKLAPYNAIYIIIHDAPSSREPGRLPTGRQVTAPPKPHMPESTSRRQPPNITLAQRSIAVRRHHHAHPHYRHHLQ